jgi:hypothetical protein
MRKTPYTENIHFSSRPIEGSEGYWGQFSDPFEPEFRKALEERMIREKGQSIDDPWCIGYFVGNELSWGGKISLAEATLKSPSDQAAKKAFIEHLKRKYTSISRLNERWKTTYDSWNGLLIRTQSPEVEDATEDLLEFTRLIAEEYFRVVREVLEQAAPNQLYLGCRFAWTNDSARVAAAKFCDVVSFNCYRKLPVDFRIPGDPDVPTLIGEFHFGALDRGLFHTGLVRVGSQEERAEQYKDYVNACLESRSIVGCHWFQYMDQPASGRGLDGENYQIGFVDICDTPYPETIQASREIGSQLYSGVPR